ncbi:MAG: hypothetical protein NZL93_06335, partial [Chthoniobacterales bacterium]|nr:hypothetical protein [Chthoniobacterales bacterium]
DQHKAGLLALSLGQTDKARHYFKAALAAKPTALGSLSNLAHLEFRTANYSEAIKHYSRLLSFAPTNPFITYRIYLCEILSGNLHPPDPNAFPPGAIQTYFALAAYHSQTGNSTQSKQLFAEARARFPNLTSSYERDFALIQKSSNPQSRINTESIEIELSTKDSAFQNPFPPSPENSPYSTNQPIQ